MKKVLLITILLASPLFAAVETVGVWNFNDGTTADTSGIGVAANGTLGGGAAIVADPLGSRGSVLYVPVGGVMTTPAASESKFDSTTYTKISFWAYTPSVDNGWWSMVIGKGGAGAARTFVDNGGGVDYLFNYSDIVRTADNSIFNLSAGAWGDPKAKNSGWHYYESAIWQNSIEGVAGFAAVLWTDGVLNGYADTQGMLESGDMTLRLTDDAVQIGGMNGWTGYVDDVKYEVIPVPEPITMTLLGLGALALRRRK